LRGKEKIMQRTLTLVALLGVLFLTSALMPRPLLAQININCCPAAGVACGLKAYGTCSLIRQKANGICVYGCPYTEACTFTTCSCESSPLTLGGVDTFRLGPTNECPVLVTTEGLTPGD
jgi:hypothetical protein